MEANAVQHAPSNWRALFEAAVLELDASKLPARNAEAQRAITDRMEDLKYSEHSLESEALWNALQMLRDLYGMTCDGPDTAD